METLFAAAWLAAAFGVFTALIWSVYAVNRHAAGRFGYEPFSLPNAALMLLVNLLLLSALAPTAEPNAAALDLRRTLMLAAAALLALGMLVVVGRRVGIGLALFAVGLMAVGAIAVLPSLLFMRLAAASADTDGTGPPVQPDPDRDEPQR
jgi:hypothetical protein